MRSKILLSILTIATLTFSLGCGGGGGGGGSTTPTTYTVTGSVEIPTVSDSWKPSVRGAAAISDLGLTIQAFGKSGSLPTAISDKLSYGGGQFTLTINNANDDAFIKVSNSKGFDFRYHLGYFAQSREGTIKINASSTALAFLNWGRTGWFTDLADNDVNLQTIVASIAAVLGGNTTGNMETTIQTIADEVRETVETIYLASYNNIDARNTALKNALATSSPSNAYQYVSSGLHSTKSGISISKSDLIRVTDDRYTRYNVTKYSFDIKQIRFTSSTTASVTVSLSISVTPKTGDGLSGSYGPTTWVMGWKNEGTQQAPVWRVWQDFPYLKSQFNF